MLFLFVFLSACLIDKNARVLKDELKSTMEDISMVTVGMFKLYNYFFLIILLNINIHSSSLTFCMFVSFEGFVTDGEFDSLQMQGSQRPVSVIQLIMDAEQSTGHTIKRY